MGKISINLHRDGNVESVSALTDRTGKFLMLKAMRLFNGDVCGFTHLNGAPVDLEATLEDISAQSTDLQVVYEGESLGGGGDEPAPEPEPAGGGGGRGARASGGGGAAGNSGDWYTAAASLRVRDGCEKDSDIIHDIPKGEAFEVIATNGDWFKIALAGHPEAWVLSRNKARSLVDKKLDGPPPGYVSAAPAAAPEPPKPAAKAAPPPAAKVAPPAPAGSSFYKVMANMNVREAPGSMDAVTSVTKGDVINCVEAQGDWFRINLRGRDDVWVLSRNKVKSLVEPVDSASGMAAWQALEDAAGKDPEEEKRKKEEEEKKKKEEEAAAAKKAAAVPKAAASGGGDDIGDLPPPPPSTGGMTSAQKAQALAAEAAKPKAPPPTQAVSGGGAYWVALAACRVRDEPNSSGEVIGELAKKGVVKVLATQGDWLKVENVWEPGKGGGTWLMYQNSKGKQMAEPGGDASAFNELKAQLKAAKEAAENGEAPPDIGGGGLGGGGGFGEVGGGGFAKKEVSAEEAELLKMLKGFGSSMHENGGGGDAPPPAAAAAAPPKEAPKKPPAPKPKPPAPKPKAAPSPPAAAAPPPASSSGGGGDDGGDALPVQKALAGGTFWKCLSAIRARDEASASGEVVGEMSKGDYCHVLSQEGDWCKIQNIWDTRADVYFMYQVAKTGKQLAEPAGDQGEASAGWTAGQEKMKAGAPSSPGGGFGEVGGGGFAKKEVSAEEAELLQMLKGFGSSTQHEGGGGGDAPPPAAAAAAASPASPSGGKKPPVAKKPPAPKAKPAAAGAPPSGTNPNADEEAEMLAMLKGLSSGGGGDDDGGGGGSAAPKEDNRPLEERVDDSNWAVRKKAYEDLEKIFKETDDGDSDVYKSKVELVEAIAKEKNANAFAVGVASVRIFMETSSNAGQIALPVAEAMVKAGFKQAKAKIVEACRKTCVACVACAEDPVGVFDIIFAGANDSGPKIPVESTKVAADCVTQFGPYALGAKMVAGKCVQLLDKADKKVAEQAQKMLVELVKYMGKPCLLFALSKLNEKDSKALETKLTDSSTRTTPQNMVPPKQLKFPVEQPEWEWDGDGCLVLDLVEPVDMLANLKATDYAEKIKSAKWNEKVAAMEMIVAACGSPPKLLEKDYSSVIKQLEAHSQEKMVAVAISAVTTLAVVADGMGAQFKPFAKSLAVDLIGRTKDAKLVAPVATFLSQAYGRSLTMKDVFSSVNGMVFPKKDKVVPPHATVGVLMWCADCASKEKVPLSKDEVKDLTEMGMDVLSKVSDPKIKAGSVELMTQLLLREKRDGASSGKAGFVSKALEALAEAKDSGSKLLHKKILAAADPEAVAAAEKAAADAKQGKEKDKAPKKDAAGGDDKKKSSSKAGAAAASAESSKGGGGADSATKRLDMDDDTALNLLEQLKIPDFDKWLKALEKGQWQEKVEACEQLGKANYRGKVHSHSPALVALLQSKTKKFTEKNANVLKGCFQGVLLCAKQASDTSGFDKGAAKVMIEIGGEKIGDKKMAPVIRDMLTALAESCSPGFVAEATIKAVDGVKAGGAHQECADWMHQLVKDFGVGGVGEKLVGQYCCDEFEKARTQLKDPKTKDKMVVLAGLAYSQKGPTFEKKHLKSMSKEMSGPATAEFEKVGYDKAAAAAPTKVALGEAGAGGDSGGSGDREDLKLDKDVMEKLKNPDNKKWKDRKEAMDKVISTVGGSDLKGSSAVKDLAKALATCLSDLQLNNKPLAAQALGELFTALDASDAKDTLKAVIKPLCLGVADGKKSMRDACIEAIDKACHAEGVTRTPCCAVLIGGMAGKDSGLVKPVSRLELLEWGAKRFGDVDVGTSFTDLVPQLLSCMNDKDSKVRGFAEQVVAISLKKDGVKPSAYTKGLDKLSGAEQRSTKEKLEALVAANPVESATPAAAPDAPAQQSIQKGESMSHNPLVASPPSGPAAAPAAAAADNDDDDSAPPRRLVKKPSVAAASKGGAASPSSPPAAGQSFRASPPAAATGPPKASPEVMNAAFADEVLKRLDTLLAAPRPLNKESDLYLQGKDVIKVVHSLASGADSQFAFDRSTLITNMNSVLAKLSSCLNLSFACAAAAEDSEKDPSGSGAGGIDVQLLSVCLAALMALFRLPELCLEVKPPPLRDLLACTCSRLLDDRLAATRGPYATTAAQVIKALNKISIQSAIQAPRASSLSALLYLLCHPVQPTAQSSPKFANKIGTIFAKLFNRVLAEEIESETATGTPFSTVHLPTVMYALNDFFTIYPHKDKGCEAAYDAATSLLKRMVLHIGSDQITGIVNKTLPGAQGRPLLTTIQKEMPGNDVRRSQGGSFREPPPETF